MKSAYRNRFRVDTARLKNYDYGGNGLYFVTICTGERFPYFGKLGVGSDPDREDRR
jgi:putative transposase